MIKSPGRVSYQGYFKLGLEGRSLAILPLAAAVFEFKENPVENELGRMLNEVHYDFDGDNLDHLN